MYDKHGKNQIELTEYITKNDLPHTFETNYHHIHMDNTKKCNFTTISHKITRDIHTNTNTHVLTR